MTNRQLIETDLTNDQLLGMYRQMHRIRVFELTVLKAVERGLVAGGPHLYVGEEAIAVGVCTALEPKDYITSTHRGHGHLIAKGGQFKPMLAEIFAKATGYCKGKGGTMHIADLDLGILGANGIVGGGIPAAVGAALSSRLKNGHWAVACFFGDAATNTGAFHEAANFASLYRLPVVFVCENNLYGISVSMERHTAVKNIADRAAAYAMPGVIVDGNDVVAVYEAAGKAVKEARKDKGPSLVECKTYRFRGHFEGDPNLGERYRDKKEIEKWMAKCPISRFKSQILMEKVVTKEEVEALESQVHNQVKEAMAYAEASPFPNGEHTLEDVFI